MIQFDKYISNGWLGLNHQLEKRYSLELPGHPDSSHQDLLHFY